MAHLWAANSLVALKKALSQAKTTLSQSQEETHQAAARADQAEMAMDVALAKGAEDDARVKRAEGDSAEDRARVERAEKVLEIERQAHAERIEEVVGRARAAEEDRRGLEVELGVCRSSLDTSNFLKAAAEERAESAEEIAQNSDAQAIEMKAAVAAAEMKVVEAVENFCHSAAFREELADATAFAYNVGFQDCKDKARKVCNLEDLEKLEPDEAEESPLPNHSLANDQPPEL